MLEVDEDTLRAINAREAASSVALDATMDALKRVEEGLEKSSLAIQKLAEEVDKRGKAFFLNPGLIIRLEVFDSDVFSEILILKVESVDEDGVQLTDVDYGTHATISVVDPDEE